MRICSRFRQWLVVAIFVIVTLLPNCVSAQTSGMLGTEFWTGFIYQSVASYNPPARIVFQLCFVPIRDCDVVVSHAPTAFQTTSEGVVPIYPDTIRIHLRADSTTFLTLPNGPDLMSTSLVPVPQGIHVSSTDTIALYTFSNIIDIDTLNDNECGEIERAAVWPVDKLGCDYTVNVYKDAIGGHTPECLIVAAEDSVHVTVSASSDGAYPGETSYDLRLGEVVRVRSSSLAGRRVTSAGGKRIAVLSGAGNIYIPAGMLTSDHIFASMPPSAFCGRQFLLALTPNRLNDRVQVISLADNNTVTLDGVPVATLSQGEIYECEIDTGHVASWLESSHPVSVFVYLTGSSYGCADSMYWSAGSYSGDPSMYPLCPVEQWYTRSNFFSYDFPYHVNVVLGVPTQTFYPCNLVGIATRTQHVAGMTLDGIPIDTAFLLLPFNPEYSYARMRVGAGTHRLENALGPFEAHAVTLRNSSAMASATGWAAIETPLVLNRSLEYCQHDAINLDLSRFSNYDPQYTPVWDLGNGTTKQGATVTLASETATVYHITVLFQHAPCLHTVDTLHLTLTIHPAQQVDIYDTIDQGQTYQWQGQSLSHAGSYSQLFSTVYGCDSLVTLHLYVTPSGSHSYLNCRVLLPNAFTPGLETNNLFGATSCPDIGSFSIYLYSRTGNLVWYADDIDARWDGTYKGLPCPEASYVYIVRFSYQSTPNIFRAFVGQVLLIR